MKSVQNHQWHQRGPRSATYCVCLKCGTTRKHGEKFTRGGCEPRGQVIPADVPVVVPSRASGSRGAEAVRWPAVRVVKSAAGGFLAAQREAVRAAKLTSTRPIAKLLRISRRAARRFVGSGLNGVVP